MVNSLERIVPPLEMCKLIPVEEFAESALVWTLGKVEQRPTDDPTGFYTPAPTLAEIIEELPLEYKFGDLCMGSNYLEYVTSDGYLVDGTHFCSENDGWAAAALRLWFRIEGIEVE